MLPITLNLTPKVSHLSTLLLTECICSTWSNTADTYSLLLLSSWSKDCFHPSTSSEEYLERKRKGNHTLLKQILIHVHPAQILKDKVPEQRPLIVALSRKLKRPNTIITCGFFSFLSLSLSPRLIFPDDLPDLSSIL